MRVALSSYRSKPHSGGQGVYVRNLSRELVALGHEVEVFSGQPYPELDPGVKLTKVPSLDLYRPDDPFRHPARDEFRDRIDWLEYATMLTGGFPEPRTFSLRLARLLADRVDAYDVLHDNQTLGPGILDLAARGLPVLTTIHHPISRDRRLELEAATTAWRRYSIRRWYGFVAMQRRVARRTDHVLTVSKRSAADIVSDFDVAPDRIRVVPVGVDIATFHPPTAARVAGRIVSVASADTPLKGLSVLLDALARPELGRGAPGADLPHLVIVGTASRATEQQLAANGLTDRVRFVSGLPDADLAGLMASAQVLAVPSRYEGFSLPAIEAMACGTPIVASQVGALPELVGGDGTCGRLVPPGDEVALAQALAGVLAAPDLAARLGEHARRRAVETYSWTAVARATAAVYEEITAARRATRVPAAGRRTASRRAARQGAAA